METSNTWMKFAGMVVVALGVCTETFAWEDGATEIDGIHYNYFSNGRATVAYATSDLSGNVHIPSQIKISETYYQVTSIEDRAFYDFDSTINLTSVSIPNSVTSIGMSAFANCHFLESVTIPNSVTSIGSWAFSDCHSLTTVTIPHSITEISSEMFYGCYNLMSVTIPNSVTNIDWYAFDGCSSLTSVTIPDSVTSIGEYAFHDCSSLTSLTIPDSVTNIAGAFDGCSSLTSVTIPNSMTSIGGHAFNGCSSLMDLAIPDSVTSIGAVAFRGCKGLTNITIPDSVTSIGEGAFQYCSGLASVTIPDSVTSIGDMAFFGCTGLNTITIPDSLANIPDRMLCRCSGLTSVMIPNSVTNIDRLAFSNCSNLQSVVIGSGVLTIGNHVFEECGKLVELYFKGKPPMVPDQSLVNVDHVVRGYYTAEYAEEWKTVIGSVEDGMWEGLTMEEELHVERADPVEGSLTLAWAEEEADREKVTYSVWRGAGEKRKDAECVTNGLTENTWTDTEYWKAEPVLKPLNYWVVAKKDDGSEHESNRLETRRRFGLFVGLNEKEGFAADARLCKDLASKLGEFKDCPIITGGEAQSVFVRGKMAELADKAEPGDLFLLFISTHGGEGSLDMDGWFDEYKVGELQKDVRQFDPGVAVVGIIMACHSGSMIGDGVGSEKIISWILDAGAADCRPNIAWITSCGYGQLSLLFGNASSSPTPFGVAFLQNGWQGGYADGPLFGTAWKGGNGDGKVTFYELARYAREFAKGYSDEVAPAGVRWENGELLKSLVAGMAGSGVSKTQPDAPATCTASQGKSDASIQVNWSLSHDTAVQSYWLFRKGSGETTSKCISRFAGNGEFLDPGTIRKTGLPTKGIKPPEAFKTYTYYVQAVSPQGVSAQSPNASGFAGTQLMRQWLEALGFSVSAGTEAAASTISANGHDSVLACYVAGLDPNNPNAAFEAELVREDGKWKAKPRGGEKAERVYRVEGKREMTDEEWTDVTDVEDLEAEGWRFFRVGVELAE